MGKSMTGVAELSMTHAIATTTIPASTTRIFRTNSFYRRGLRVFGVRRHSTNHGMKQAVRNAGAESVCTPSRRTFQAPILVAGFFDTLNEGHTRSRFLMRPRESLMV